VAVGLGDRRQLRDLLLGVGSLVGLLVLWEYAGRTELIPARLISYPTEVTATGLELLVDGSLLHHLRVSGEELVGGYALAAVVGLSVGLLMGWYRRVDAALQPHITFLFVVPQVAFLPLVILWFGLGVSSKVALVFLATLPLIVIGTRTGVRDVDAQLVRCARSLTASDSQIFWTILIPAAIPHITTALRVAVGPALVGVVVAEFTGASAGIGYLISSSASTFRTAEVYVGILTIGMIGVLGTSLLSRLEARFRAWRPGPSR
jgi:NitT/TauT family transport system permease protein